MIRAILAAATAAIFLAACGTNMSGYGGSAGVTAGGAQDIGLARAKIADGIVPQPEDFVAEGLYSEHDLPLDGAPCQQTLCLQAAAAVAPEIVTGGQETFIQLGMGSNIDLGTFRRRALNTALVIDRSGSMSGDRLANVKAAAKELVDRLGPDDLFTLITFNSSANHVLGPQAVTDRAALKRQIDKLSATGGTCIECGLRKAHDRILPRHSAERDSRILLMTDARPNVGATGEGEFTDLVSRYAEEGVYLTAFGVGMDFGQELVTRLSRLRGANYVFLEDGEKTARVFSEDFDLLVTPVAFDLQLEVSPAEGFGLTAVYGIPGEPGAKAARLEVKTLFLSRRRGAIVVRLDGLPEPGAQISSLLLDYTAVGGGGGPQTLEVSYPGAEKVAEGQTWFSAAGVRKTVALTNFILGAKVAVERFHAGDAGGALEMAVRTADHLRAEADALADAGLEQEAALAEALARLLGAD